MHKLLLSTLLLSIVVISSCSSQQASTLNESDVETFLERVELEDKTLGPVASSAYWIGSNFITYDSQKVVADYGKRFQLLALERARQAATFDKVLVSEENRRKLNLIKNSFVMPSPLDDALAGEIAGISAELDAMYGAGQHCFGEGDCYDLEAFEAVIDNSRDPDELLKAWEGWRNIGKPMKDMYLRMVEIGNLGAKDLGYDGLTDLWFSQYDMPADDFLAETDRVWDELKPLYDALHCHVRNELSEHYGEAVVSKKGSMPAHVLGNMWGQSWANIYDLVYTPDNPTADTNIDLTKILEEKDIGEIEMVEIAENFFLSLGFEPLPKTFWERSLFIKPQDHNVVCHASAWDLDSDANDLRVKMCIERNAEDFSTIHHELGHIFYYQAYSQQPSIFQGGANDGFHEAVGDLLTLSITPDYYHKIGMITEAEAINAKSDPISLLMQQALDGVVSVPWTLMLDKWRAGVFSGETSEAELNNSWWELREYYQGIKAPRERDADAFDPGAKYHIPGNTPYTRYYLAKILQYQFHESLCNQIGFEGPLHECSIYNNELAGEQLRAMLSLGQSQEWQVALEALTGTRTLSGKSMLNYYKPLKDWLDLQNASRSCGWEG
ncbi:MAG: peptidyl-dipeptidase [SAR86 cluster bacterium BACL1 MAG-121105-bin34]|jgi:peptidyl-dipeptidase A|uniref:Peptidyl-dipeptidase n=2 Tax=SAR86 cluster TaxID=62672 RepID=A0A0R2UF95_9GAMM|nr:MAG: peptidyl-dipeptidase [SAR86 cluster bacterium BACL1 MAG-120507-bin14]KRO96138.1 MAG: peptidyl-dipeptidase [SAR86 cluster bacterium BACL1 MAG-120820-bin45]KRO96626.1 MAG: peptidyl-dipeptidase [SAR86 cluster bacterium BACL1 MAG-120828-bin5]KRO99098.1 MAG: peptidyl-dipeptidase [SAR86 cluster bacterium BACL1 MAG-120823-bin87]KRP00125.1 MAG: peptidyl-dipeptidase [SAR86 cluster bacterium BACL1 MAG-120813-bin36]KRP02587.1 MAG: peptidyl-dipeptidase [SAR86 cluster bacterium BACL1 MAG-120924-bin